MAPPGIVADTDYLVVESTYGNRQRPAGDPMAVLGQVICDTAARGGGVIPAFAVGRAKALLYYLPLLKASSAIPASLPIFVDSQSFNLLARTRVIDKVALPLFCARCSVTDGAKRTDTARAMLAALGIAALEQNTPARLSGGRQQRVAIARPDQCAGSAAGR